jgi:O-antigen ligase
MRKEIVRRIYRASIVLIAFLIPSAFYGLVPVIMVPVFLCWLYFKDYTALRTNITKPVILLPVSLYLIVIAGFFFSENRDQALQTVSTRLPFLVYPLIIGTASSVDQKLLDGVGRFFVWSVCLFIAIPVGYACYDVWSTGERMVSMMDSSYDKFSSYGLTRIFDNWHPTYVAMFANLAIAIQINFYFRNRKTLLTTVLIILFLSVGILLLNSMIAIGAYICLILYFLWLYLKKRQLRLITKMGIVLLMASMAFGFFYWNPMKIRKIETVKKGNLRITDDYRQRNLLTIRLAKWDTYKDIIKEKPILGTTEGDIKELRKERYLEKGYSDLALHDYNAHNQYIEIAAIYGLIGLGIFLGMMLVPLFRNVNPAYYVPFILISSITFLTETVFYRQQGLNYFMFFYTLYTCVLIRKNYSTTEDNFALTDK